MISRRTTGPHRPTSHRTLTGILLTLSLLPPLLLVAACGRSTTDAVGTASTVAATTPTLASSKVVPGPQLQWQQMPAPPGLISHGALWSVAPANGDIAYTYVPPDQGSSAAHSYVTHDHGATWTQGGDIAVGGPTSIADSRQVLHARRHDCR